MNQLVNMLFASSASSPLSHNLGNNSTLQLPGEHGVFGDILHRLSDGSNLQQLNVPLVDLPELLQNTLQHFAGDLNALQHQLKQVASELNISLAEITPANPGANPLNVSPTHPLMEPPLNTLDAIAKEQSNIDDLLELPDLQTLTDNPEVLAKRVNEFLISKLDNLAAIEAVSNQGLATTKDIELDESNLTLAGLQPMATQLHSLMNSIKQIVTELPDMINQQAMGQVGQMGQMHAVSPNPANEQNRLIMNQLFGQMDHFFQQLFSTSQPEQVQLALQPVKEVMQNLNGTLVGMHQQLMNQLPLDNLQQSLAQLDPELMAEHTVASQKLESLNLSPLTPESSKLAAAKLEESLTKLENQLQKNHMMNFSADMIKKEDFLPQLSQMIQQKLTETKTLSTEHITTLESPTSNTSKTDVSERLHDRTGINQFERTLNLMNSHEVVKNIAEKITIMKENQLQEAKISINNHDLGEVNAKIKLMGNQVDIVLSTNSAQTKDLMDANLVKLRDMLDQDSQGQVNVSVTDEGNEHSDHEDTELTNQQQGEEDILVARADPENAVNSAKTNESQAGSNHIVDVYL